jgi:hypothetical protein
MEENEVIEDVSLKGILGSWPYPVRVTASQSPWSEQASSTTHSHLDIQCHLSLK